MRNFGALLTLFIAIPILSTPLPYDKIKYAAQKMGRISLYSGELFISLFFPIATKIYNQQKNQKLDSIISNNRQMHWLHEGRIFCINEYFECTQCRLQLVINPPMSLENHFMLEKRREKLLFLTGFPGAAHGIYGLYHECKDLLTASRIKQFFALLKTKLFKSHPPESCGDSQP